MIHGSSTLTVTSEIACLPAIQSFAREFSREVGFSRDDQEMILLALEEAVVNVIEHAFESAGQSFQIVFEPSAVGIRIIIKEKGLPYDPRLVPGYEAPGDIDEMPSRGLGSFIMKKCVDEVFFCNLGKEGRELHLIKRLPAKSIVDRREAPEPESIRQPADGKTGLSSPPVFELRLMKPSEALEVSRLFYRTYGYSYLSDVMYYPDRLAELNREGLITSVVAVTPEGEIAGHLAMVRDSFDDPIAETGKGAVKESFRGFDLFTGMQKFLMDKAKTMGLKGIYGRSVTTHTFTQRMTEKTGCKDCAVVLGYAPADMAFKGQDEGLPQRQAVVCCFQAVVQLPVSNLYAPSHHESIIGRIYSNLGLTKNFRTPPGDIRMADRSALKLKVTHETNGAEIVMDQYGEDCISVIRTHVRDLCAKKIDHITLFLNLGDPVTSRMCKEIEKLGFFIAGIIPCLHFEDTLILQYLNNLIMDHSKIKLHSAMAKEILAYIEKSVG
jgi:anti-sigma regulatory factor (Ser/Thr protein kinase)